MPDPARPRAFASARSAVCRWASRLRRDQSGQSTVILGLFIAGFLLGFIALGVDVNYLFQKKRMAQSAADTAAVAAAEESSYGSIAEQNAADAAAKLNGFDTTLLSNPATVTVSTPTGGSYANSSGYVQAVVSETFPTFFLGAFQHFKSLNVSARAVAALGQSSPTCICLEGQSGQDLNLSNGTKLTMNSCGAMVDSSAANAVTIVGGSSLSGLTLGSVSRGWDNSTYINNGGSISSSTKVVLGVTTQCSPSLPTVPTYNSSQCTADPLTHYRNGGSTYSVGPGSAHSTTQNSNTVCYDSLTVGSNGDKVNLNPGIYVISGGELHFESGSGGVSNTGGNGVFFYLTGGASLVIDNGANPSITAATSGSYSNVLLFQSSSDSSAISIQGGSNTSITGAIFAPASNVTLGNGSSTSFNTSLVANTLTMTGGASLTATPQANFGTLNMSTAKLTE